LFHAANPTGPRIQQLQPTTKMLKMHVVLPFAVEAIRVLYKVSARNPRPSILPIQIVTCSCERMLTCRETPTAVPKINLCSYPRWHTEPGAMSKMGIVVLCTCVSGGALSVLKLIHHVPDCLTRKQYNPSQRSWFRLQVHLYCLIDTCSLLKGTSRFCACRSRNKLGQYLTRTDHLIATPLGACTCHALHRHTMLVIVNDFGPGAEVVGEFAKGSQKCRAR
jgi:hypothetical protein